MSRISPKRIKELQKLLKEQTGRDYTDEEAQKAGLSIMRFVVAKEKRKQELQKEATNSHKLPKDPTKPFTVNGIKFANRKEYDERVKEDARKMAEFLYHMYKEKKLKEEDEKHAI